MNASNFYGLYVRGGRIMGKNRFVIWLFALLVVFGLIAGSVFAAGKGSGYGMLKSVEEDGTVIIDDKGYLLSSSVAIQNHRGERLTLRGLNHPDSVYFEYEITTRGFVITLIKQSPR